MSRLSIILVFIGITLTAQIFAYFWWFPQDRLIHTHSLCILIPFRDRDKELNIMVPKLNEFLKRQKIGIFHFLILNQVDHYRFNRASLINVGWFEANNLKCDYMAMHDVDIVPINSELNYQYPGDGKVVHIASGKYHPIERYDYANFIGGVLLLTMKDFQKVNGMSNNYWGWGLEDDEFFLRLRDSNLTPIVRQANLSTNRSNTFLHIHSQAKKRDHAIIGSQKAITRKRDRHGGLNTTSYRLRERKILTMKNIQVNIIDIELNCNLRKTPYCVPLSNN